MQVKQLDHVNIQTANVEAMVEWCRNGPPGAHVEGVETAESAPEGDTRFRISY